MPNSSTFRTSTPSRIFIDISRSGAFIFIFFFFQAEDGIRDLTVTGVQTCALPISRGGRLEGIALRYFNVFGPRQDPNSPYAAVIPAFLAAAYDGRPAVVYGDGRRSEERRVGKEWRSRWSPYH